MAELHDLQPHWGATRERKRVGRGIGSGKGKTAGRGHKGQKSRSGDKNLPPHFEGGQTPLYMRVPKRGFRNPFKKTYTPVNVGTLNALFPEGTLVTPELLAEHGLCSKKDRVKILGDGELTKKLVVKAHAFSKSAKEKIEKAGGSWEVIGGE
ncbi:MAG: 50S ribosomal protein L15 [Aquificae bacterium]|nr:50S ribosomal protein L15 [Aquificota bacterium]